MLLPGDDEVETYRAFRTTRLRRYRGGSDLACTDFNEIFHLREEDRLLKQYVVSVAHCMAVFL
jgi:hypothetical protein